MIGTSLISDRERRRAISVQQEASGRRVPVWDQEVTDAQGRRRFHGAFTGGFSAGYFNSVGSEEGWQPSNFVSSRGQRATTKRQRPEDFMDEDDDPMMGRSLAANQDYDTLGSHASTIARRNAFRQAVSGRGALGQLPDELVVPVHTSVGKRLLHKLGWREGQGLGPRQRAPLRGRLMEGDAEPGKLDPHAAGFRFAPKNTRPFVVAPKKDAHGLGFNATTDDPRLLEMQRARSSRMWAPAANSASDGDAQKRKSREVMRMTDALSSGRGQYLHDHSEDAGGMEIEIYAAADVCPLPGSTTMPVIEDGDPGGHAKSASKFLAIQDRGIVTSKTKPDAVDGRVPWVPGERRCSDGTCPLPGFRMAKASMKSALWWRQHSPGEVPRDFVAVHRFSSFSSRSLLSSSDGTGQVKGRFTTQERGAMLGERTLPRKSMPPAGVSIALSSGALSEQVSALLSVADRRRLSLAAERSRSVSQRVPLKATNLARESVAKPETRVGGLSQPHGAVAGSALSSRFTSGSAATKEPAVMAGLRRPVHQPQSAADPVSSPASSTNDALAMPMETAMRREITEWTPERLLCKRFNVPPPSRTATGTTCQQNMQQQHQRQLRGSTSKPGAAGLPLSFGQNGGAAHSSGSSSESVKTAVGSKIMEAVVAPPDTSERPSINLFRSLFGGSDDDEDGVDESSNSSSSEDEGLHAPSSNDLETKPTDAAVLLPPESERCELAARPPHAKTLHAAPKRRMQNPDVHAPLMFQSAKQRAAARTRTNKRDLTSSHPSTNSSVSKCESEPSSPRHGLPASESHDGASRKASSVEPGVVNQVTAPAELPDWVRDALRVGEAAVVTTSTPDQGSDTCSSSSVESQNESEKPRHRSKHHKRQRRKERKKKKSKRGSKRKKGSKHHKRDR